MTMRLIANKYLFISNYLPIKKNCFLKMGWVLNQRVLKLEAICQDNVT
jgi:hypothetical protein